MKKYLFLPLLLLSTSALAEQPVAKELSATEIVNKSNIAAVYPENDGRAQARMLIVDSQDRKQQRQFVMLRKNIEKGGVQKYFVYFTRPNDVARTSFLVNKNPAADDDRWMYLPGLDLVKRIGAGDKRTSFIGSNFLYEDISGRNIKADNFSIISQDEENWLLKAEPKNKSEVEFAYYEVQINKQTLLPMRAEYYDDKGVKYRRISAEKVQTIQNVPTIVQMRAENLRDGSYTVTQMRNIRYNENIPETVFSERSLRAAPQKWLQFN